MVSRASIEPPSKTPGAGNITTTAIAPLAHSTPPGYLFSLTDFNSYVTVTIVDRRTRMMRFVQAELRHRTSLAGTPDSAP